MSKPASGTYIIANRVPSPNDERLVITFNGPDQPLTVKARSDCPSQHWIIQDYDANTQSVTPVSAATHQVAWGTGHATVLPAYGYVWTIRYTNTGYTIQDGGVTAFWGVADVVDNATVTIGPGTGNENQRWFLEGVL
ncbi:hypothetical protein BDR03DRAFT_954059 [Suillus americanus]|nr:hypothetical protein BDR03DRAFT_954059 [Suillus americanus]